MALVERRIEEAVARGEFDNLPGAGKPLDLDDDLLVPEELRVANRILRNSGYAPPEIEHLREINQLIGTIERAEMGCDAPSARRLRALMIQLELGGQHATARTAWLRYEEALAARLRRD